MRRQKLKVEDLRVESFTTEDARNRPAGTVRGYDGAEMTFDCESTIEPTLNQPHCTPYYTVPNTCAWTCNDATCYPCPSGQGYHTCDPPCDTGEMTCIC